MIKTCFLVLGLMTLLGSATFAHSGTPQSGQDSAPKVGDDAPDWKLKGSDGKVYKLSDYKGKKAVVVAWYPMALTGG